MNGTLTLFRREYWEHRGRFFWLPIVIFGLFMLAALIAGIAIGGGFTNFHPAGVATSGGVATIGFFIAFVFYVIFAISCIAYMVTCLSEDRVDKSVLFWRSLPVSDTATVLAKIGAFALLGTLIIWIATIVTHLVVLFALASAASARGAAGFTVYASWIALLGTWALVAWAMLLSALWWLPYIGWLLAISAIFRKRTWLWAAWPPIAVGFIEEIASTIFTGHTTSHFFTFITRHLATAPIYPWGEPTIGAATFVQQSQQSFRASAGAITNFITLPSMWIGVGIGIGLIVFAIVARRYSATV
jgi:ABC-2 type transport system permease protein